jgi:LmbE family N-acetylglucosaminyl deacetylase
MRRQLSELEQSAQTRSAILGTHSLELDTFPDNRMDGVDLLAVIKRIESTLARLQPERVFTHHDGDVNIDHVVIHRATIAACRPMPGSCVREIAFSRSLSST